jgi:hypothetical protein
MIGSKLQAPHSSFFPLWAPAPAPAAAAGPSRRLSCQGKEIVSGYSLAGEGRSHLDVSRAEEDKVA